MTSVVDLLHGKEATASHIFHNGGSELYTVEVFYGSLSGANSEYTDVHADKTTRAEEIVTSVVQKLALGNPQDFELTEVFSSGGQICKERRLFGSDNPVKIQLLWPRLSLSSIVDAHQPGYNFMLRRKEPQQKAGVWMDTVELNLCEGFLTRFLQQPRNREYQDLCNLPDLNENTLLENLKKRFNNGMIYTYVGSILISINPFRFFPIYNPKYVRMYQNRKLSDLPPHIFAIADSAYHTMMKSRANQCIVISGESGSGKTESTNLLLHHLSALSQRGFHSDGIEQSILGVGPVLEAFGNAKTVHNNNSSRFGKFVQVNYRANGAVHGASVEKYLLEKSRIVSQASNERNYHVFYYLLAGANSADVETFYLGTPREYFYLNQNDCYRLEGLESDSEFQEFARLRHAMDVVGFSTDNQQKIFTILSAVLHIGNIEFKKKSEHGHHDEAVGIKNMKEISIVSKLLKVKEATLIEALTKRKTMAGGEMVVMSYKMAEAISTRDAMSKCLYSALFDWIVFQINTALVSKHDTRVHEGNSIGVLDIFGFEDFHSNSFEQFCINYANESLHYYFNQHIFKFEQEEYMREGIQWKNIEFIDNTECLDLFCKKPTGLLYLLDEECSFPSATNETLLNKFSTQHRNNLHFEVPQTRQSAFSIVHYAGKVKYCIQDFREKNSDLMRHDILILLKNSNMAFLRELIGQDPLAVLRWALVRVFFRACFAFIDAGRRHRKCGSNMRFAGSSRPEPLQKRIPLLSESRISLFGDRSKSKPERRLGHSPSLELSHRSPFVAGGRMFRKKSNRRLSCPGEHEAIAEVSKNFRNEESGQIPLPEKNVERLEKSSITVKNKVYRPRFRAVRHLRDIETNKTLASGKVPIGIRTSKTKAKPRSISAQFHNSLQRLMDTLNQANPFFIRCIKSNAEKAACVFDEELVQRQLRYTGMLATVKIRQSGYNYRLSFEDFIYQYHLLLPEGRRSSRNDIVNFLYMLDLNQENYQIGATKVFLRETEKLLLEDALHQALLVKIKLIQHWIRGRLQRQKYLQIRSSTITLQALGRGILARRKAARLRETHSASIIIQSVFRGFKARQLFRNRMLALVKIQKVLRGFTVRKRFLAERKARDDLLSAKQQTLDVAVKPGTEPELSVFEAKPSEDKELLLPDVAAATDFLPTDAAASSANNKNLATASVGSEITILRPLNEQVKSAPEKSELLPKVIDKVFSLDGTSSGEGKDDGAVWDGEAAALDKNAAESGEETRKLEGPFISTCYIRESSIISSNSDIVDGICTSTMRQESIPLDVHPSYPKKPIDFERFIIEPLADKFADKAAGSTDNKSSLGAKEVKDGVNSTGEQPLPPDDRVVFSLEDSGAEVPSASSVVSDASETPASEPASRDDTAHENYPLASASDNEISSIPNISVQKSPSRSAPQSPSDFLGPIVFEGFPRQNKNFSYELLPGDVTARLKLMRDNSPSGRRIEKSQSAIIPTMRTQAGPKDLEIEVKPVIVKALSEEILSISCQTISRSIMPEKKLNAPLAKMESVTDEPITEEGVEIVEMVIEDEQKVPFQRVTEENISHGSSRSPFRRPKKARKQLNAAKEGTNTDKGYDNSSRKIKHNALRPKPKQPPTPGTPSQSANMAPGAPGAPSVIGSWTVSGTAQWKYPLYEVVRSIHELRQLEQFFTTKTSDFNKSAGQKDSVYDVVMKEALSEFHSSLITQVSTAIQESIYTCKYRDLMCRFEEVLSAKARQLCKSDDAFPETIFINAFRGYVDEFIRRRDSKELPDVKVKKDSVKGKKKKENIVESFGHKFLQSQFTIPTFCEICSSVIWVLEKAFVCKVCKLTVHKKCYEKSHSPCSGSANQAAMAERIGSVVIGAPLSVLVKDGHQVPPVIERLIAVIEMNGLYTVGVYRKPGNAAQIKQLIKEMNINASNIDFSDYNIHILTSLLKAFFREMPEPLMTFDLYGDFIQVAEISDEKDRIKSLYNIIEKLPQTNHNLLKRLIFHLARVAHQEELNLMSPSALAIIFAPSILRAPNEMSTQESLSHVPKQTLCIQCIIESQLKKIKSTLADIRTIVESSLSANEKLATLRASKRQAKPTLIEISDQHQPETPDDEILMLSARIQSLQDEKETLTNLLPSFDCRMSNSEEDLLSTYEVESTGDELVDGDDESLSSANDNGDLQRVARNLTRHRNRPPPQKTEKYRFVNPPDAPDSPFELKPARSDPELHDLDDDDLFD